MKAGGGKAKGSAYERELCRKVSLWITHGERDDTVWRSASSGAVHTVRKRKKESKGNYDTQVGDLCSIHPLSEPFFTAFGVEAKRYGDLKFENLVFQILAQNSAQAFWQKHVKLCSDAGKVPVGIFKQDRRPDMLLVPLQISQRLKNVTGVSIPWIGCCAYVLDDFVLKISPEELLAAV